MIALFVPIRRRVFSTNVGLLGTVALALNVGCVSPPVTVPSSPTPIVRPSETLSQDDEPLWLVNASTCCDTPGEFAPGQLSFGRVGLAGGKAELTSLESLTTDVGENVPVCILVHGYGFDMERAVEDARSAVHHIRRAAPNKPVHFVLFHWPSELERTIPWAMLARDIRIKGQRADVAGHYLAWLIEQFPPHQRICIVSHSLGCRVAACSLQLLGGGKPMVAGFSVEQHADRPINAVFGAAALDHDWLCPGERYGESAHAAREILVLTNPKDSCLRWYPLLNIWCRGSLGRGGLTKEDREKLNKVGKQIREISVEDDVGSIHNFRNYMKSDAVAQWVVSAL